MRKTAALPEPRAVALDLDGTLVDSRADIAAACNHAITRPRFGRRPLGEAEIAAFVGDGGRNLIARALRATANGGAACADANADVDDAEIDAAHDVFVAYYAAHPATFTRVMPGAAAALDAFARRALPLAVVTNKSTAVARAVLDAVGLGPRFAVVVGGGDDSPLKPDPAPVHAAAAALGVVAPAMWMIGDGVQDIVAGRAAGAPTIAVLGGFTDEARLRAAAPDVVVASLADVVGLVGLVGDADLVGDAGIVGGAGLRDVARAGRGDPGRGAS